MMVPGVSGLNRVTASEGRPGRYGRRRVLLEARRNGGAHITNSFHLKARKVGVQGLRDRL